MNMAKEEFYGFLTAMAMLGLIVLYIWYMVTYHSFGSKCEQAGYSGSSFERCVNRTANGGPVYEINAPGWNQ